MPLSKYYNIYILSKLQSYMEAMHSTMYVTHCKLEDTLLKDVLLDKKYFASSLISRALDELDKVIDEVLIESQDLEKLIVCIIIFYLYVAEFDLN